ncbi:hypothetical protein BIV57_11890 [Mangrovactinospora gilvigrisea]|uniref:Uncharacterized protein n=1 Tax=Mangrovactinospora gilvigrisea TaxID=1428644 RepID=A0A1J7BFC7_9ACTN|nr:hypothetical protein [Mangrovactinospora gilvigrisea]OIV37277.1 hypothetical protein BIV57_11890 [Mangrovactinospora gilvigrisea]
MGMIDSAKTFGRAVKRLTKPKELIKDLSKAAATKALEDRVKDLEGRIKQANEARKGILEVMSENAVAFAQPQNSRQLKLHNDALDDWERHIKYIGRQIKLIKKMIKKL